MDPLLIMQNESFPNADGRKPEFILRILEFLFDPFSQAAGIAQAPKPDVRIKKQFQSRNTSQSLSSDAGLMMSPKISISPFMEPIQSGFDV